MKDKARPVSYSEGYISTPNPSPQTNIVPLLLPSPTLAPVSPLPPLPSAQLEVCYNLMLRFSMHLALISLFETVFFWLFVSKQENNALERLMDSYTEVVFSNCSSLPIDQRTGLIDLVNRVVNATHIVSDAYESMNGRTAYNTILLRNSWLYVCGLVSLFGGLAAGARIRHIPIHWAQILGENAAMIVFLGAYEWMFFSTIVLKYQAMSASELNLRIVDELYQQCRLLT